MPTNATAYLREPGGLLSQTLPGYEFVKSEGFDKIVLNVSSRSSPFLGITFDFGKSFSSLSRLQKQLGLEHNGFHINQNSLGRSSMKGFGAGKCNWNVLANKPVDATQVKEIATAIGAMATPFFQRFSTIEASRDALAENDSWCLGGKLAWKNVLLMDIALNDRSLHSLGCALGQDVSGRRPGTDSETGVPSFRTVTVRRCRRLTTPRPPARCWPETCNRRTLWRFSGWVWSEHGERDEPRAVARRGASPGEDPRGAAKFARGIREFRSDRLHGSALPNAIAATSRRSDGQRMVLTREEWECRVESLCGALRASGVTEGDSALAVLCQDAEAAIAAMAVLAIGASLATVPPELGAPTVVRRFEALAPRLLMAHVGTVP